MPETRSCPARHDPLAMFTQYVVQWDLIPDGNPIITHSSRLLPVRQHGIPAMLKVAEAAGDTPDVDYDIARLASAALLNE